MTTHAEAKPGTSPVVWQGAPLPLGEEARKRFTQETIDLLAAKLGVGAQPALVFSLAELASRYDLDPFANEIWLANMGGRDGGTGSLAIMVGRDGYLKVARRDRDFIACPGTAVYANDHFEAEWVDDEKGWAVQHKITNLKDRGEPLGAWARLLRKGKPAIFFFAPLSQFKKSGGAWKYEDAMIVKCAQSYVLRTTYGVSGAVPFDEVSVGFDAEATAHEEAELPGLELPERIAGLFARAEAVDPLSWRRNELEARIFDTAGAVLMDEVRRVEQELEEWLAGNEPTATAEPDEPPAAEPDEEIADADVVEGDGEAAEPPQSEPAPAGDEEGVQARYDADEAFREKVEGLLTRSADLTAMREDADAGQDAELVAELDAVESELDALGVPRGWVPRSPGQGELL